MGLSTTYSIQPDRQAKIQSQLGIKVVASGEHQGDFWVQVKGQDLLPCIELLRNDPDLDFNHFVDLCGVDYLNRTPRFESVIHLYSMNHKHRIRLRVLVPDDTLSIPSLVSHWDAANWQERESFDMYGIRYEGHPKLDRILSPPETEVFPQRKDYALKGDREKKEVEE